MKSICITGANAADLHQVAGVLHAAGMKSAKPAKPDTPADIAFWHEQVLAAAVEEGEGLQAFGNLGRLWEQMAADIFVANHTSKVWGWADPRSTWLLDFWLQFEPRLNFVLVVTSPQHTLASAIAADAAFDSVDDTMAAWHTHHQELLRFYHRNPQRCLLVDAQDCADHPQALVQRCKAQWKLPLDSAAKTPQPEVQLQHPQQPSAISHYLALQLCQAYPAATSLQHEIAATVSRLDSEPAAPVLPAHAVDPLDMVGEYRALRRAKDQQAQLAQERLAELAMLETQCDQLTQDAEKLIAANADSARARDQLGLERDAEAAAKAEAIAQQERLRQQRDTLADERNQLIAERDAESAAKLEATAQLDAAALHLKETQQESELLLLQLHQVQEELETYFLKHQEAQRASEQFAAERDAQAHLAAERQSALTALQAQNAALAQEQSKLIAAHADSTRARDQLGLERDAEAAAKAEAIAQQERLRQQRSKLIADYDQLARARDQLGLEKDAEAAAKLEAIAEQDRLRQQRDALADERNQLIAERDTESAAKLEATAQLDAAALHLKETQQESELLLLQLHQVQEELETYFLKHHEAQTQLDSARADATQQTHAAQQENQRLQSQLHHVQAELDASLAGTSHLIANIADLTRARDQLGLERDALAQERNQLAAARDAEAAAKAEANVQRDAEAHAKLQVTAQLDTATRHLKETQQESELLLLQLHQVQEELEHYFLQHQDAQRRVADADQRWARMLQRTPAYCDFESIDIIGAHTSEGDGLATSTTEWRITNLTAAGRNLPQLDFKTVVENGVAGYVISRQAGSTGFLTRWPAAAAGQTELNLGLNGTPEHAAQTIAALQDIATADWDLLQTLGKLLTTALDANAPTALNAPASFQPEALRTGLGNLAKIFEQFPPTLRFDAVSLKREQVNPDYEHLWLRLSNLAFGGKRWAEFEFRLSCANVRPKKFGGHPKLEFPEHIGQAPFTAWFDESFDDFGAKLELRFALPDAMDTAVWQSLSDPDRAFLQALIARLPAMLATLEAAGTKLRRPWADWTAMAHEVQRVLTLRTATPAVAAPAPAPAPATPVLALVPAKTPVAAKPAAAAKTRRAK